MNRRDIDYMIWEVDENADGKIDWDEFQLVYYRNVVDKTENEPTAFFHILEVINREITTSIIILFIHDTYMVFTTVPYLRLWISWCYIGR